MKILVVDSLFSPMGGGQKIAYSTYKILERNNNEVFYFAMNKEPYFENDYKYQKFFTSYYFGTKDYLKNPFKYYYNHKALKDLQSFTDYIKPDIIHFQSFWGLSSSVFKVKTDAAKILTIHDARCCPAITLMYKNKELCTEQYCKKGNFLPCILNKCVNNSYEASIRRSLAVFFDIKNYKFIDKFITPSDALKKVVLNADIGIPPEKIFTLPNYLSNDELQTVTEYTDKGYFLYIGRLSKEKGVHYLLNAIKELPKEINLHIAGTGPDEEKLKKYVKDNGLYNVCFVGFKSGEALKQEYQNCISTILPCNWFEIFGMTNIESFANAKPVIASNAGGIPEIVEHNKTGLLFEPGNVEQLKECILKYYNNPLLAIEHGRCAYKKVFEKYTEEQYYNKLIKLYEDAVNESK